MNDQVEPRLAPPGAGLPKLELFIARRLFGRQRRTATRESCNAHFQAEREAIRRLVRSCDASSAGRRVLIARPRGLEDSSRYWSIWMTLEHLRIVHGHIARTIETLAKEAVPEGKASTAAVKPAADVTEGVVQAYEDSCEALLAAAAAPRNLETVARFAHPWFGPLNGAEWHLLAGRHLGIHREQIERIVAGLKARP